MEVKRNFESIKEWWGFSITGTVTAYSQNQPCTERCRSSHACSCNRGAGVQTEAHAWPLLICGIFSDSVAASMSLWCNFTVNNATCCICLPRVSVIWMLQIRDIAFVLQFTKCSLILTHISHWFFFSFSHSFASISGKNLQLPWKITAAQKQKLIVFNGLINHPTWANHRATTLASTERQQESQHTSRLAAIYTMITTAFHFWIPANCYEANLT